MSTVASTAANPNVSNDSLAAHPKTNPFDTLFDGGDSEDEWWEEEDTPPHSPNKASTLIRTTQWPNPPGNHVFSAKAGNRFSIRKPDKRFSVQKPTRDKSTGRQKKQNAKAGIKLVTNLTRHQAKAPIQIPPSKTIPQMGCFVDLAALQALNGESTQSGGFWKSRKPKELTRDPSTIPSITRNDSQTTTSHSSHEAISKPRSLFPSPRKSHEDLSPDDRPIVIGLSIPSRDVAEHTLSPQTASSETSRIVRSYEHRTPTTNTPETPTIIITPAQGVSLWSMLDHNISPDSQPRPASSVYSQAGHYSDHMYTDKNAPPVPQMPASVLEEERQRIAGLKSCFSPDSDDATTWNDEEDSVTRSRVVSTCTVFEEDESPVLVRDGRARPMSGASRATRHPSMSTIRTQRLSTGWWNYVTTPFLTRSNTFATKEIEQTEVPALPSLAIAATKAHDAERDGKSWEKEFSPLTPETTTSLASDRWWNQDSKHPRSTEQSPVLQDTRHKVQASTGTLPIILSEVGGFGSASMSSITTGDGPQLSRDNTTSTFHTASAFSSSDREVPVLFDAPNTRSLSTNNPFVQPQSNDLNIQSASRQVILPVRAMVVQATAPPNPSPGEAPPPPYSPSPARIRKYRAVFPPGHALGIQYPISPGPVSPAMQEAMSSGGAIPMSNVPLTPPSRRPINLNSGYSYPPLPVREDQEHFTAEYLQPPSKKAKKAEAKRQRHEKEDAIAQRAGGWWRGRGCIPDRGCYGRSGAEGRKKRRWYLALIIGFLSVIILAVVLATQLHRRSNNIEEPSQWLNVTGFPPIFVGLSTVAAPVNIKTNTGCVFPSTQWSCDLPKELQESTAPNQSNQPNFLLRIQWDNSTEANLTFANVTGNPSLATRSLGGNAVSAGQFMKRMLLAARQAVTLIPTPEPPASAEGFFLGNTTDGIVSSNKAGEPTPFYMSFLSTEDSKTRKRELSARQSKNSSQFPNLESIIPSPSLNSDGTVAPANLLPFPNQQPIRLYDRGLHTEHYGFYTYYDRTIFLKSITRLNETNLEDGAVPDDENGGATEAEAKFRCTWTQTRFLVQMHTRMNTTARLLNSTKVSTQSSASGAANFTTAPQDFAQPGSFPYPITITLDRHGGDPVTKMLYCYEMNDRRGFIKGSGQIHDENRGFGGTLINKAPSFFRNASDPSLGGFDGGNGGCGCKWRNFEDVVRI